jgi:uroporphyrinogen-III synthase
VDALAAQGLAARALPLIDIVAVEDLAPLHRAWVALPQRAFVMFVSANAVRHFFSARPPGIPGAEPWPAGVLAGCTGAGTQAALRAAGVPASAIVAPAPGDAQESESLWRLLAGSDWQGRQVSIVRGEDGRDWLAERWREAGADVDFVTAYGRRPPRWDAAGQALLEAARSDPAAWCWHFSSSQAVGHLVDQLADHRMELAHADASGASGAETRAASWATAWAASWALSTHPRIAQAALRAGFGRVDVVAPGLQAAVEALAASGRSRLAAPHGPGAQALDSRSQTPGAGEPPPNPGELLARARADGPGAAPTISR